MENSKPSAGDSQPLVGVSLDSVVQKAKKLAHILQTCKHSLENQPSPGNWGRGSSAVWLTNERCNFFQQFCSTSNNLFPPGLILHLSLPQWRQEPLQFLYLTMHYWSNGIISPPTLSRWRKRCNATSNSSRSASKHR